MAAVTLLSVEDCISIVKQHLKTELFEIVGFSVTNIKSEIFALKITINYEDTKKTINFIAKHSPELPKINKIVNDIKTTIPQFDGAVAPKFYRTISNLLVYKDPIMEGFQNYDSSFFDLYHTQIVLESLAKLHAASLAYEEIKSEENRKVFRLDKEYDLVYSKLDLKAPQVNNLVLRLLKDESEDRSKQIIEHLEAIQSSSKFRRSLCHNNLISENIMFKIQKDVPQECKLIDFEDNCYVTPAYDVLQLIFFTTNEQLRQHHLEQLLSYYYNCLNGELKKYDINIAKILTSEDLLLAAHNILPLIKLETAVLRKDEKSFEECKEILRCPLLTREDCYAIVKNKILTSNYKLLSFKVSSLGDVSGFLGEYHKLQIKIEHSNQEETIDCFIKCSPNSGTPKAIAKDVGSFVREAFMYNTLVPKLLETGIHTIADCIPACYYYVPEEFMVFDDLSLLNFNALSALKPFDFDLISLSLKKLAKFHGSFLVFEEKMIATLGRPYRIFDEYRQYFDEPLFFIDDKHLGAKSFITAVQSVLDATALFPEIKTEKNQKNFEKWWPQLKNLFYTVARPSESYRNVLSHGDIWTSNILMKLDSNNKPIDCRFIDFQIIRYCPLAYDVLAILHLTTDRTTRLKYEEELKAIYYEELSQVLQLYNYQVDKIYPYDEFKSCIDYMKPQMVLYAACECVLTMCTPAEIALFLANEEESNYVYFEDRKKFMRAMCEKSPLYRKRLQECLLDIYDYCDSMCSN